jgi:hypothetical protein
VCRRDSYGDREGAITAFTPCTSITQDHVGWHAKRVTIKFPLEWEPEIQPVSIVMSRTQDAGEADKAIG